MNDLIKDLPKNIVAEKHEVSGKWVFQYLDDEQAHKIMAALTREPEVGDVTELADTLEIAIGDMLYMANERGQLGRFQGTVDRLQAALAALTAMPNQNGKVIGKIADTQAQEGI